MRTPKEAREHLKKVLKSGKYKQCKHLLEELTPDGKEVVGNCCLGVACREAMLDGLELSEKALLNKEVDVNNVREVVACTTFDNNDETLPHEVKEYYGFATREGFFEQTVILNHPDVTEVRFSNLIQMNDSGLPFEVIADYIDQVDLKEK